MLWSNAAVHVSCGAAIQIADLVIVVAAAVLADVWATKMLNLRTGAMAKKTRATAAVVVAQPRATPSVAQVQLKQLHFSLMALKDQLGWILERAHPRQAH